MLAWIDLETTGLDPAKESILELALVVTDNDLNVVSEWGEVLHWNGDRERVDPVVDEMHQKNGLWDDAGKSFATCEDAERRVLKVLERYVEPRTVPLCGSTIGFDRVFLRRYMPKLERHFHYRNLDVSTLGELALRWFPQVWDKRPRGDDRHRALGDVLSSIALLKYWRETILPTWEPAKCVP